LLEIPGLQSQAGSAAAAPGGASIKASRAKTAIVPIASEGFRIPENPTTERAYKKQTRRATLG
jgi:hypothetical protein